MCAANLRGSGKSDKNFKIDALSPFFFTTAPRLQEVFIFCVNKKEDVQDYICRSKWPSVVGLRCISSAKCMGTGDALREMDTLGLVRSNPFVLISGDVVATVDLAGVVAAHKRRRAENSLSICTVVLSKVGYDAAVHARREDLAVGLDAETAQLVLYQDDEGEESGVDVELDLFKEEGHPEIMLRSDLMDCHIYVCSPEVLVAFSDNWDYQDMGRFLRHEVESREMGNKVYSHVTLPHEYAARVHDPHVYHAVSKDLLHRWLYPSVPETNRFHAGKPTSYRYHKRWLYREEEDAGGASVHVSRFATVSESVMLGRGTSIGAGSVLSQSVLGRRVKVGSGVHISDSHLWQDVVVEDGAVVESSILSDGVVVRAGARVGRGSLLSYGVVVGKRVELPPFSRLTATPVSSWEEEGGVERDGVMGTALSVLASPIKRIESRDGPEGLSTERGGEADNVTDTGCVGVDGIGHPWNPCFDGERVSMLDVRAQSIGAIEADEDRRRRWEVLDEEEEEEEGIYIDEDGGRRGPESDLTDFSSALARSLAGVDTERGTAGAVYGIRLGGSAGEADTNCTSDDDFAEVVRDMIISGFASRHAISNLLLEIKSFKFAQNRSYAAVMRAVVPALLDLALDPDAVCRHAEKDSSLSRRTLGAGEQNHARGRVSGVDTDPSGARDSNLVAAQPRLSEQGAISNIATQLQHWKPLLVAFNQEDEVEEALLEATEAYALESKGIGDQAGASRLLYDIFGLVLLTYVNEGLLSPAIAVAWADAYNEDDSLDEKSKLFREARTQKFVKWVREYEVDDSTSSDEGTSDSE